MPLPINKKLSISSPTTIAGFSVLVFVLAIAVLSIAGFYGFQKYRVYQRETLETQKKLEIKNSAIERLKQNGVPYDELNFIEQVIEGNSENVSLFITAGMNPNTINKNRPSSGDTVVGLMTPFGATALQISAGQNNSEITAILLEAGADPNLTTSGLLLTPLEYAFNGHLFGNDFSRKLSRIRFNALNEYAEELQPITPSSEEELITVARLLLTHGALSNITHGNWLTNQQELITSSESIQITGSEELYQSLEKSEQISLTKFGRIASLIPDCTVNGRGDINCTFKNSLDDKVNICSKIFLKNTRSTVASSESFCSGDMSSGEVKQISINGNFTAIEHPGLAGPPITPYQACTTSSNDDWTKYCRFSVAVPLQQI